ncbi:MAG: hypothetical protein WDW38_010817 [Sanguina aurantia]
MCMAPAPAPAAAASTSNPFNVASTLPFQAPPFDKIHETDYQPAIEEGMQQHLAEITTIADNPEPPTFDNTFVAMEKSGAMLTRVMMAFEGVAQANTTDGLQKVQEIEAPKLAAHRDAIELNSKLFARVEAVYNQRDSLKLDPESLRLVETTYRDFVRNGAKLSDADKTKLKDLNKEESTLSTQFTNKLLAGTKAGALVVDDKAKLDGLSDADLEAAAGAAKQRGVDGKWVVVLQNTTQQPALQDLNDRATREALYKSSWDRVEHGDANDTREMIERIAQIRAAQAKLLGFPNYAAWKLDDQMAKTPDTAIKFMQNLVPAATARAGREAKDIQSVIDQQKGGFKVQAWDWEHYSEQVRKAKYNLDEAQIKPYFEIDNVLQNGVFFAELPSPFELLLTPSLDSSSRTIASMASTSLALPKPGSAAIVSEMSRQSSGSGGGPVPLPNSTSISAAISCGSQACRWRTNAACSAAWPAGSSTPTQAVHVVAGAGGSVRGVCAEDWPRAGWEGEGGRAAAPGSMTRDVEWGEGSPRLASSCRSERR